jgi:Uma2 family endonuclease
MLIETERRFFTRHDLERMFEAGILEDDERVELLDGEIIKMSNPGRRHIACTNRTNRLFVLALEGRAIVSIQNPLVLDLYNEPKPDVVVVQPREDFYQEVEIAAEHVLLIVEIADTTLAKDRRRKLRHYVRLGLQEYWIEDVKHNALLVYREPTSENYNTCLTLHRGETVSPLAFPDITFKVDQLLG